MTHLPADLVPHGMAAQPPSQLLLAECKLGPHLGPNISHAETAHLHPPGHDDSCPMTHLIQPGVMTHLVAQLLHKLRVRARALRQCMHQRAPQQHGVGGRQPQPALTKQRHLRSKEHTEGWWRMACLYLLGGSHSQCSRSSITCTARNTHRVVADGLHVSRSQRGGFIGHAPVASPAEHGEEGSKVKE